MRVSLSTLVEILKVTKSSVSGSTPRFILRRAQESHGISINFLICAIVMLLILLLVLSAAVMLLQGLLESAKRQDGDQLEAPIQSDRQNQQIISKVQDISTSNTEDTLDSKFNQKETQLKASNYDKSTQCMEESTQDSQEHIHSQIFTYEDKKSIVIATLYQSSPNLVNSDNKKEKLVFNSCNPL